MMEVSETKQSEGVSPRLCLHGAVYDDSVDVSVVSRDGKTHVSLWASDTEESVLLMLTNEEARTLALWIIENTDIEDVSP